MGKPKGERRLPENEAKAVARNLRMKRFHARGRGKSSSIMKPFAEITVVVRETAAAAAPEKSAEEAN
jgi:large subunit ribosomal protein L22